MKNYQYGIGTADTGPVSIWYRIPNLAVAHFATEQGRKRAP